LFSRLLTKALYLNFKNDGMMNEAINGSLLDTVETVLHFAETLTFKGQQPVVTLVETVYKTGVKLTQQAMAQLEQQIK
jgi:hypothetical protein